jgi:hypothetical protein
MSTNAADLFDVSDVDMSNNDKGGSNQMFKPDPDKGIQGVWKGTVRFLPNLRDKANSMITKYEIWLENPMTGDKKQIDTLRTIGKGKECPITKTYWHLKENKDASLQVKHKDWSQSPKYYTLVQILDDKQNPDNVGKIMVWKFGSKVKPKIDEAEKPAVGKPRKPIDIKEGWPMYIEVPTVGGWPNYDKCRFVNPEELDFPTYLGPNGEALDINNNEDLQTYANYLLEESPDLSRFSFKEWTQETRDFIDECIQATYGNKESAVGTTGRSSNAGDLKRSKKAEAPKAEPAKTAEPEEDDDILSSVDDIDVDLDEIDI